MLSQALFYLLDRTHYLKEMFFYLVTRLGQRKRLTSARQLVSGAERIN